MEAKPLAWTPKHVARFWEYWASRPDRHSTYFAFQVGQGVCRFLQHACILRGARILDYGAGPGYLSEQLIRRGAHVSAVEFSSPVVDELNQRFRRDPSWEGAKPFDGKALPWPDDTFDAVVCLETIEHVLPEHLNDVLRELLRVTKPGGTVLLTTPNSENLRAQTVFCPECCHEFHRWQHVRSWTPETLERRLENLGYEVRFCRGISFHDFQPDAVRARDRWRLRFWRRRAAELMRRWRDWIAPMPFPSQRTLRYRLQGSSQQHLAAVSRKPLAARGDLAVNVAERESTTRPTSEPTAA